MSQAGSLSQSSGGAPIETVTPDTGSVVVPVANNINVLGRAGSKTDGSGATLTVRSPPYANQATPATVTLNSGTFATAAITLTTPATAGLQDGDLLEFVATNGVLVIQLAATQVAHLGSAVTSVAGTPQRLRDGSAAARGAGRSRACAGAQCVAY